ncbi:MAG: hypothetical protein HY903_12425 [Deltaproteobacteria bacterium]|nr:hypothetical protein [Deltaproteobacteria bacterium]
MTRTVAVLLLLGIGIGCTNADVYSASGNEPLRPDRIAITGRVCTDDATGTNFPMKGLVMFDATASMFNADLGNYRFCGSGGLCAPGSVSALIDRLSRQKNAYLGFARVGGISVGVVPVLPGTCGPNPCDAQQFFSARNVDTGAVQAGLSTLQGGLREVTNAISLAQSFIAADLARASAGEVLRSRYLIFMLFAGPPQGAPVPDAAELADQVEALKRFVYARGALEFRLNVGLLSAGLTDRQAAIDRYAAMAFAGDGLFHEFAAPSNIDCQLDSAATTIRLVRKDIAVYNLNARLGPDGSALDSDGDGLTDSEELAAQIPTDPTLWDTDNDGIGDRLEFRAFPRQNPLDPNDRPGACLDPLLYDISDKDLDLLNDCEEGLLQSSATIPDSDGDGLTDYLEFMSGTVPTSPDDRLLDFDGDGLANAQEVLEHTNPRANEGHRRGAEGYRNTIVDLGEREIATMEDAVELRAVTFRAASAGVKGGAGLLRWTVTAKTMAADLRDAPARSLEWSDARWQQVGERYDPIPVAIDQGTGVYTLSAQNLATRERVSIDVFVVEEWLPATDVEVNPSILVSERDCYDVRFSNIKLMQTAEAVDSLHPGRLHEQGTNHILIFFTQAPSNRLASPGIAKVAEIPVRFLCADINNPETCARKPEGGFVTLDDSQFSASVQ